MKKFFLALLTAAGVSLVGSVAHANALPQDASTAKLEQTSTAKTVLHPRDRHGYRDRHRHRRDRDGYRNPRHRHGYYDRGRYGRGYYGPSRYQGRRCWREERYGHFRGRPALVSDRVCRDRRGYIYVERGSTRLIHYIDRRGRRGRY